MLVIYDPEADLCSRDSPNRRVDAVVTDLTRETLTRVSIDRSPHYTVHGRYQVTQQVERPLPVTLRDSMSRLCMRRPSNHLAGFWR